MKKPKKKKEFDKKAFIQKELRGAFRKCELYSKAKKLAQREYFVTAGNGNQMRRVHYECNMCHGMFLDKTGQKEIAVDHVDPIVRPEVGWTDYNDYIERLFCAQENLQVLCKPCHKIKTKEEGTVRTSTRAENKKEK